MKIHIDATVGRGGGSSQANRAERKEHVQDQIAAHLSDRQALGVLQLIQVHGQGRSGHLRLDGTGGSGSMKFSTRWNIVPGRSAKGEVTGAAVRALFEKAGLPTDDLDSFLAANANRRIAQGKLAGIIAKARDEMPVPQPKALPPQDLQAISADQLLAIKQQLDGRRSELLEEIKELETRPAKDPWTRAAEKQLTGPINQYRAELSNWRSMQSNFEAKSAIERIGADSMAARAQLPQSVQMFRTVQFRGVEVAGAARPSGGYLKTEASPAEFCALLHTAGYRAIVSIDSSYETNQLHAQVPSDLKFQTVFQWSDEASMGLSSRLNLPLEPADHEDGSAMVVPDYEAPTLEALKDVVGRVVSASEAGGQVFIHCGGGAGRTGTFLAALMIQDRFESARRADPDFNPLSEAMIPIWVRRKEIEPDPKNAPAVQGEEVADGAPAVPDDDAGRGQRPEAKKVEKTYEITRSEKTYPWVHRIIEALRERDDPKSIYHSVETEEQVQVLNEFIENLVASQVV